MKQKIFKLLLITVAVAFIQACGHNGAKSTRLNMGDLTNGSCLNMEKLLSAMAGFPADLPARKISTQLDVQGSANSKTNFLIELARGNYIFEDRPLFDLKDYSAATQSGCNSVALVNQDGKAENFQIQAGGNRNSVIMINPENKKQITVELTSDQSLTIETTYQVMDPCDNDTPATVNRTVVLKWSDGVQSQSQEKVSTSMLRTLAESTDQIPSGIAEAMNFSEAETLVKVSDLKALRNTAVRTNVLACFPPAPAPIPDPELPNDSDTTTGASPTPASSPAARPAASPAPAPRARIPTHPPLNPFHRLMSTH